MPPKIVEVVFVFDSSESMRPCIQGLIQNLDQMLRPLQGFQFQVRVGLLALSVGISSSGDRSFNLVTLAGDGLDAIRAIYGGDTSLFSETLDKFSFRLRNLELGGDEDHLLALDCACDFPFSSVSKARRVIALFSDEKIEDGLLDSGALNLVHRIIDKISARQILLFAALPESDALFELGSAEGCQVECVPSGDGLASVDFRKLLSQMAKTISQSSLQGAEGYYEPALFGQNRWVEGEGSFDGLR